MELLFSVLVLIPANVFLLTFNPGDAHPAMEWCLSEVDWPLTDGLVCAWPVTSPQIGSALMLILGFRLPVDRTYLLFS